MSIFLPAPASCSTVIVLAKSLAHQELSNWSCVWCLWCPSCMLSRAFCLSSHAVTLLCCLKYSAASQAESTDLSLHSCSHKLSALSAWLAAGVYPPCCAPSLVCVFIPDVFPSWLLPRAEHVPLCSLSHCFSKPSFVTLWEVRRGAVLVLRAVSSQCDSKSPSSPKAKLPQTQGLGWAGKCSFTLPKFVLVQWRQKN